MNDTCWVTSNKHLFKTNKMFPFVKGRVHYLQKWKVIFYMHSRPLMPLTLFYETQFESISSDLTKLNKILIAAVYFSLVFNKNSSVKGHLQIARMHISHSVIQSCLLIGSQLHAQWPQLDSNLWPCYANWIPISDYTLILSTSQTCMPLFFMI